MVAVNLTAITGLHAWTMEQTLGLSEWRRPIDKLMKTALSNREALRACNCMAIPGGEIRRYVVSRVTPSLQYTGGGNQPRGALCR